MRKVKLALRILGILVACLAIMYLTRRVLFERMIAGQVESSLADLIGAQVEVGAIRGNWLTSVTLEDVQVRSTQDTAYREITNLGLELDFSPWSLVLGNLSGLEALQITGKRVVLDLSKPFVLGDNTAPGEESSETGLAELLAILGGGAIARFDELVVLPEYVQPGAFQLTLDPGDESRQASLDYSDLHVSGGIDREGLYSVEASGDGAGRLLRSVGVALDTQENGEVSASLTGDTGIGSLRASGRIETHLTDGNTVGAEVLAELTDNSLRIPSVELNLPGILISGSDLDLPRGELVGTDLDAMLRQRSTGSFEAQISDLEPYESVLPEQVKQFMPISAELGFEVRQGVVQLKTSRILTDDMELRIDGGSFSLVDSPLRDITLTGLRELSARGIHVHWSTTRPVEFELPGGDAVAVSGTVSGDLAGSAFRPEVRLEAKLTDLAFAEYAAKSLETKLTFDGNQLVLDELKVEGARRGVDAIATVLAGSATLSLPQQDGAGFRVSGEATCTAPPSVLSIGGVNPDLAADLAWGTARASADLAFSAGTPPAGGVELELRTIRLRELEPVDLLARANLLADGGIQIHEVAIRGESQVLRVSGTVDGQAVDLRGSGSVEELRGIADYLDLPELAGEARVDTFVVQGALPRPNIAIEGSATLTTIGPAWLEFDRQNHLPGAPLELELAAQADSEGIRVQNIRIDWGGRDRRFFALEGAGSIPIVWPEDGPPTVVASTSSFEARLQASAAPLDGHSRIELAGEVDVGTESIRIPTLIARASEGTLEVSDLHFDSSLEQLVSPNFDIEQVGIRGELELRDYTVGSLLGAIAPEVNLGGWANGAVSLAGSGERPQLTGVLQLSDGDLALPSLPELRNLNVDASFSEDNLVLTGLADVVEGRQARVEIELGTDDQPLWAAWVEEGTALDGRVSIRDLPLGFFTESIAEGHQLGGLLTVDGTVSGTLLELEPEAVITLRDGMWQVPGDPALDEIQVQVHLTKSRVEVTRCEGKFLETPVSLTADLTTGDESLWSLEADSRAPIEGFVRIEEWPLEVLPEEWTGLADLSGSAEGSLTIGGSLADPQPLLILDVKDASLKLTSLPRIDELSAQIEADKFRCSIEASASMGAAPVRLGATITPSSGAIATAYASGDLDAWIKGERVLLQRAGGLKLRGDLDLTAKGNLEQVEIAGEVVVLDSKYVKRISLVPDLKMKSGASSPDTFGPWQIPGGEGLTFDVGITTQDDPIQIQTNVLDTELDLSCRLKGQGNSLHLVGVASGRSGTLRFPGMSMTVQSLQLIFNQLDPTRPEILATASGRRHGIRINMRTNGPWDDPTIGLSSTPALQPKELWALVTTGVRPASLAQNSAQSNTAILATYVLQELLLTYVASESTEAQENLVARFTFEYGSEISENGRETWQVDFDVGELWVMPPAFGLRLEQDVYEDINIGLVYRWRF